MREDPLATAQESARIIGKCQAYEDVKQLEPEFPEVESD